MASVGFSIAGDFLTDHSRNLIEEGRWQHAIRTLVEGLHGMTHEIAFTILRGDAKLVGVNDIDLEDDDASEYKKRLAYRFGGVFRDTHDRHWRPYAVVTAWGRHDMLDNTGKLSNPAFVLLPNDLNLVPNRGKRRYERDARIYADNPMRDLAIEVNFPIGVGQKLEHTGTDMFGDQVILCAPVDDYPVGILTPFSGHDAALNAVIERLKVRGSLKEVGADDLFEEPLPPLVEKVTHEQAEATLKSQREDDERRMRVQATQEAMRKKEIERYREEIIKQAAGDFFDLKVGDKVLRVPTAPFENWALWRTSGAHLAKPWTRVSPSGMKMIGDDPYHTDWMIGAGLEPDQMDDALTTAAYAANWNLQETVLDFTAPVLCGDKIVCGKVVHPKAGERVEGDQIAIIPSASARYLAAATTAAGVIVEQGGAMAHLVTVAREEGVTIMRVEKARESYPAGSFVTLNPKKGIVATRTKEVRDAFGELGT